MVWMFLVIFLSRTHSHWHEDCLYVSCCGDSSEVYIRLSNISLHGFEVFVCVSVWGAGCVCVFGLHHEACRILVSGPRIEPRPRWWKLWVLTTDHEGTPLCGFGIGQFYFSMISSHKGGRKIGNDSLDSCSQILKETRRIQDPVSLQVEKEISNVINGTRI